VPASVFTDGELDYFNGERRLARVATVGADGTPHVTPVGMWSHNPELDTIDVTGRDFGEKKKFRDVARTGRAAIVVDDMASTDPWRPPRGRGARPRRGRRRPRTAHPHPPGADLPVGARRREPAALGLNALGRRLAGRPES
jgi:pyridoxamine 5'-phosphate oxidase family protein